LIFDFSVGCKMSGVAAVNLNYTYSHSRSIILFIIIILFLKVCIYLSQHQTVRPCETGKFLLTLIEMILAKLTKRLIAIIIVSFVIAKINQT
jgi:hypothetical protein